MKVAKMETLALLVPQDIPIAGGGQSSDRQSQMPNKRITSRRCSPLMQDTIARRYVL